MTYNPQLFLSDYPGAVTGATTSATDAAIAALSAEAIVAALRNAAAKTAAAQGLIYLQNSNSRVIPNLMPLGTGVNTVASSRDYSFYFGCAVYGNINTTHRFDLVSQQMSSIGSNLISTINVQSGAVSSQIAAYIFGGGNLDSLIFSTLTITQVSSSLPAMDQMPAGVGTDIFGLYNASLALYKLTYGTQSNSSTGASLSSGKSGYSSAMQSATDGYWVGGWSPNSQVNKVDLSTAVVTTLAATLTANVGAPACVSSPTDGFSVGGSTDGANTITLVNKTDFGTEAITLSSASLVSGAMFRQGSGSSTSGVMAGGSSSNYTPFLAVVDSLDYGTETLFRLSATLTAAGTAIASSSTYSPGFP